MTLSTSIASQTFPGNGLTQIFPCAFRIFDETDVVVSLVSPDDGTSSAMTLNTDYTIAGAGDATGFTLSTTVPVANGKNLLVARVMPYTQPTDFTNQGSFFPTMHEDAMDRLGMQIQQIAGASSRSLKLPDGLSPAPSATLPVPSPLAPLAWNAAGTALENGDWSAADVLLRPDLASTAAGKGAELIGFLQPFTGAVSRTLQDVGRERVSLLDAGVVGDGSDESAKIQAALDSGKDVFVPNGTFTAVGLTFSTPGARLYGPGTIKKKAGVNGVLLTLAADDCIVDGVHFDGTASQPSLTLVNNIINVSGNRCKVLGCTVNGSAGGGITINAGYCYNVIAFNTILNTDDNNIMVSGANANDNLILGNYCDGTTQQNNIFITASPDSTATTNYNYRNRVIGNTCLNSGDTGIEAGIHAAACIIQGNTVYNSVNPEILLRDCRSCIVEGNVVHAGVSASAGHTGIAVLRQTETGWRYRAIIKGNRVRGNLTRAGILVQGGNDVIVEGNSIEETFAVVNSTTGAGLVGAGILVAESSDDITITGNTVSRMSYGINLNFGATAITLNRLTVKDNRIYDVSTGLYCYLCTMTDSLITDNRIVKVVSYAVNNTSANGSYSTVMARNMIDLSGYSGASPFRYTNSTPQSLGILTSDNIVRLLVPEVQYSNVTIASASVTSSGFLSISFEDGSEDGCFGVSKATTGKVSGTSNLLDSTGSGGGSGWSLQYDGSNNLILQRRGTSTGSGARYMQCRFTKTGNEI